MMVAASLSMCLVLHPGLDPGKVPGTFQDPMGTILSSKHDRTKVSGSKTSAMKSGEGALHWDVMIWKQLAFLTILPDLVLWHTLGKFTNLCTAEFSLLMPEWD